jgi:hypothetical protein
MILALMIPSDVALFALHEFVPINKAILFHGIADAAGSFLLSAFTHCPV